MKMRPWIFAALFPLILRAEPVAPLPNGALLLDPQHATWNKDGVLAPPRLQPFPDGDGFDADVVLAPVLPAEGGLVWETNLPKAGRYLVTLEFAQSRHGNGFEISAGEQVLSGFAPDTRRGMALQEVGALDLPEGAQTIQLKNTTTIENTFMSVGAVYLRPAAVCDMTRPEIRATLAQYKTHQTPKELSLPGVFSDHMVLQRRMAAPVWGRAAAGAAVSVRFRGQTKETRASDNGRWKVVLDPMEAGGPFEIEISDGAQTKRLSDVLVGEVWLGSGQSNMEVSVKFLPGITKPGAPYECDDDTKTLLESGCDPLIRISAVTRDHNKTPQWTALTQENCLDVPALMSSVAVLLRKKLNIPVGVVVRCESSSSSGIWLSRDAVEGDMEIQRQLGEYAKNVYPQLAAEYPEKLKAWELAQEKAKADGSKPPARQNPPPLPGGFVVGAASNGRFEHYGINYTNRIEPVIPFAVRGVVWDQGEGGTGIAGADQTAVMPALVRSWRTAWARPELPFLYVRKNQHPETLPGAMEALGNTVQINNRGLGQINHPPDKAAYARRVFEQMERLLY